MSNFLKQAPLILASGSSIRQKLLQSLVLDFTVIPSQCDEEALKSQFLGSTWVDLGQMLAREKAFEVSAKYPDHYVIAADQLCVLDNTLLNKPLNHATAVQHLQQLSGKSHQQIACVCLVKNQTILWQDYDIAIMHMHALNSHNIEAYLQSEKPYQSCGAYQYETQGKWLFKGIEGQENTVLGLPLLPLMHALSTLKIVQF